MLCEFCVGLHKNNLGNCEISALRCNSGNLAILISLSYWINRIKTNQTKMSAQICCYDLTVKDEDGAYDRLLEFLKEHCKHWCFQKEKGASGYIHYQCRMSLGTKRRLTDVVKLMGDLKGHLSPTFKDNILPNKAFYVMKPETRIEGPWSSEDEEEAYIPRQIRDITLKEWQQKIVEDAEVWDTRHINILLEQIGNKGKSTLATYCGVHKIGRSLPPLNDYKDIMRLVMDMPTSKLYLVDMPRALDQKHHHNFFAGLEEIKSGHAWDDRYKYKEKYFDCPNIWVFTNTMPNLEFLSADRWRVWQIIDDDLVQQPLKKQKLFNGYNENGSSNAEERPDDVSEAVGGLRSSGGQVTRRQFFI